MKTTALAVRRSVLSGLAALAAGCALPVAAGAAEAAPDTASVASGDLLVNLILLGLAMFILLRFLTNRAKKDDSPQAGQPPRYDAPADDDRPANTPPPDGKPNMYTNAQATWAALKSRPAPGSAPAPGAQGQPVAAAPDDEFLAGAKLAYSRINAALANRDYDDLTHFVSPALLTQLRNTLPASPAGTPEFLLIEAALAGRNDEAARTTMTVAYKALVREPGASQNTDRNERWTFARDNAAPGANWLLEKME